MHLAAHWAVKMAGAKVASKAVCWADPLAVLLAAPKAESKVFCWVECLAGTTGVSRVVLSAEKKVDERAASWVVCSAVPWVALLARQQVVCSVFLTAVHWVELMDVATAV